MNFNIYNSIILAGVIQGIIFALVVLFSKKYKNSSTFFLVGLILCCVYSNLQYYLSDSGILTPSQMYDYVFLPIAALYSVFIYFYVVKFLYPEYRLTIKDKLFFLPFFLFLIVLITYRIGVIINYENDTFYNLYIHYANFHEFFSILFTFILVTLSFKKVKQYEKEQAHEVNKIKHQIEWLKTTLILFLVLTIIWGVLMVRLVSNLYHRPSFYLLWIGIAFMTYWLGHVGVYKYGITEQRKKIREYNNKSTTVYTPVSSQNEHLKTLEKLLIKKKQFLNPTLTLDEVAKKMGLSKSHLSRIINSELDTSFTGYLNSLRVGQAKQYIENENFTNYTLAAIGLEAGFNSKSTFYKAFKKHTDFSPAEYKKKKMLDK